MFQLLCVYLLVCVCSSHYLQHRQQVFSIATHWTCTQKVLLKPRARRDLAFVTDYSYNTHTHTPSSLTTIKLSCRVVINVSEQAVDVWQQEAAVSWALAYKPAMICTPHTLHTIGLIIQQLKVLLVKSCASLARAHLESLYVQICR